MDLKTRKDALISLLSEHNIEAENSQAHKNLITCSDLNLYILSNFGDQITFSGSKNSIHTIRKNLINQIKYNSVHVDFFAIPSYGKGNDGKRTELCNEWCFIPSNKIYNSIKKYIDGEGETWTSTPKKDWVGSISKNEFRWKSDAGKHKETIVWNNFGELIKTKTLYDNLHNDIEEILADNSLSDTEKSVLTKARIGQGKYRDSLIEYWKSCPITGCKNTYVLRASHIKPWKESNNKERLDPYNGILLTANFDILFDQGLISFNDNGNIIVSDFLDHETRLILGVNNDISITLVEKHVPFMQFHRQNILKKS